MKKIAFLIASFLAPLSTAWGLTLGSSADSVILGRPLDLRFTIQPDAGHTLADSCLDVVVTQGQSMVPESRLIWQPVDATTLRVQTSIAMTEPVTTVQITGGCAGRIQRQYTFLSVLPTQLPEDSTIYYPKLPEVRQPVTAIAAAPAPASSALTGLVQPKSATEEAALPQGVSVTRTPAKSAAEKPAIEKSPEKPSDEKTTTTKPTKAEPEVIAPAAQSGSQMPPSPPAAPPAQPQPNGTPSSGAALEPDASAAPQTDTAQASLEPQTPSNTNADLGRGSDDFASGVRGSELGESQLPSAAEPPKQTGIAFNPRTSDQADLVRDAPYQPAPFAEPQDSLLSSLLGNSAILGALIGLLVVVLLVLRMRKKSTEAATTTGQLGKTLRASETEVLELARASAQSRQTNAAADAPLNISPEAMAAAAAAARAAAPVPAPQTVAEPPIVREALMQTISSTTEVPAPAPTLAEAMAEVAQAAQAVEPNARKSTVQIEDLDSAAQAWPAVQEKAEFYASIGEHDKAIALLQAHLDEHPGASPQAYLDLLGVFFRLSRTDAFEQTRRAFERDFNVSVPSFTGFARRGRDLLGGWPDVLAEIEARWPEDATAALLHDLIVRPPVNAQPSARKSTSHRGEPFDLAAFEDLLMLRTVAQTTPAAERGLLQGRRRTTPKEAELPELILSNTQSASQTSADKAQASNTAAATTAASVAAFAALDESIQIGESNGDVADNLGLNTNNSSSGLAADATAASVSNTDEAERRTPAADLPPLDLDMDLASVVASPTAEPVQEDAQNVAGEIAAAVAEAAGKTASEDLLPSFDFNAAAADAPSVDASAAAQVASADIPSVDLSQFNFGAMESAAPAASVADLAPTLSGDAIVPAATLGEGAPEVSFEPPPSELPLSEMLADMFSPEDESEAQPSVTAAASDTTSALPVPNIFPDEEIAQFKQDGNASA